MFSKHLNVKGKSGVKAMRPCEKLVWMGKKEGVNGVRWGGPSISKECEKKKRNMPFHARTSPLLVSLGKSGSGSKGVWGSVFHDNSKKGKCHKLRTYILIDISYISQNLDVSTCLGLVEMSRNS